MKYYLQFIYLGLWLPMVQLFAKITMNRGFQNLHFTSDIYTTTNSVFFTLITRLWKKIKRKCYQQLGCTTITARTKQYIYKTERKKEQ